MLMLIKNEIHNQIRVISADPTINIGDYFRKQKHSGNEITELAARILEHMGFMSDINREIVDPETYRMIDMFRKIPRNLTHEKKYYNLFIDNYADNRAHHGSAIKRVLAQLRIDSTIVKELNTEALQILRIPHVRSQVITAIIDTVPSIKEMTRVCSLLNYSLAILDRKPQYKYIIHNVETYARAAIEFKTKETTNVLVKYFFNGNDKVLSTIYHFFHELHQTLGDKHKLICNPIKLSASAVVFTPGGNISSRLAQYVPIISE